MTKRIWNWLNALPDEYEHHDHDHAVQPAKHKAEVRDRRSSPTAHQTMKRCLDARRTRQKDVHVIDLTGDQTDEDEDERERKKSRARLSTAEQAGAVALFTGRKGTGRSRKRKRGAKVAVAVGATATRILEGDIVRRGALQSVC